MSPEECRAAAEQQPTAREIPVHLLQQGGHFCLETSWMKSQGMAPQIVYFRLVSVNSKTNEVELAATAWLIPDA
ncbi:hypothetical protein ACWCQK_38215 [Streptomyces sp. NPDC002306]